MKIYIVSHKLFDFPDNPAFIPIKVGGDDVSLAENSVIDSFGDNIARLNSSFCELTAAYWIWKNSDEDIVGLVHYRRHFSSPRSGLNIKGKGIATSEELTGLLAVNDIIVAKPRNYFITSVKNHYIHAHHLSDYTILRDEIINRYPHYLTAFDKVMGGKRVSLYNMFVSRKTLIDNYFEWLFPLLFALEKKINYQQYDAYQRRVFGFMAERLFNVWLSHHHENIKVKYLPVVNIDGENLLLKGIGLLKRHFWGKK